MIKFLLDLIITRGYSRIDSEERTKKLSDIFLIISPFECLYELISAALADGEYNFYIKKAEIWEIYFYIGLQTIVYLTLAIVVDHIKMNLFKGKDLKKET
jgi:hypothetical protein